MKTYGSHLLHLKKTNRAAILVSNEALTGLRMFPFKGRENSSYNDAARWLADSLYRLNIEFDILNPADTDFSGYDLLVVPALYAAEESVLSRMNDYVRNGGHLIVSTRSGFSNEHLKIYPDMQPHGLTDCCGMHYSQFTAPKNVALKGNGALSGITGTARDWIELVTPDTAETLLSYDHPYWGAYSAVTCNHYGKGLACYIGCFFEDGTLDALVAFFAKEAGLSLPAFRFPLILHEGTNENGKKIRYFFNYSGREASFTYDAPDGISLLEEKPVAQGSQITLAPWGFKIIEQQA